MCTNISNRFIKAIKLQVLLRTATVKYKVSPCTLSSIVPMMPAPTESPHGIYTAVATVYARL